METRSTCSYCGVGCGLIIESEAGQITGVRGDPAHPANFGRLCSKGQTLHLSASPVVLQTRRLLRPALRAQRGAQPEPVSWAQINRHVAQALAQIHAQHGPDAIGFYISGQLLSEDYQAFNKIARGLIGTNHIDSNSRLCMSSAVAGYKQTLGSDAPPTCYEDLDHAECVFISGANPAWAHPILFRRLEAAKAARPSMKIIVVDPRRTETAEFADLHLPIRPGSDVALCLGMLHSMIWDGLLDTGFIGSHTQGFEELKALAREMSPREAARLCGVAEADLRLAARWFAQSPATLSLYCQGLNQSSRGTAKNTALINLHLATGQIAKPGAGPFSLTGQPNAMGGREVGGMASLLPGHRDPANLAHRAEVAALWGVERLPSTPGLTAIELFEAAARGEIKALWIACTNPAQSLPDQALVRRALARCELVVLQECFADTATAALADVLLPASTWGEKEGTVTNSERRISRVRAAVPPPGEARADWRIVRDVARELAPLLGQPASPLLDFESSEDLWLEHRAATCGRDLDISGLSYAVLEQQGPQQWPFPAGAQQGIQRLYQDRRFATDNGRAQFVAQAYQAPAEAATPRFPLLMSSSRLRDQWHGMSRSGVVSRLFGQAPTPALHMHAQDMARRGLSDGALARLSSARGQIIVPVHSHAGQALGQVDLPMHWGPEFVSGRDAQGQALLGVNALTQPAFCPDSKQPELKLSAVEVQALALPWRLSAAIWVAAEQAASLGRALRALMDAFDYAHCVPVAPPSAWAAAGMEGWHFEGAHSQALAPDLPARFAAALDLRGPQVLRYSDAQRGRSRMLRLSEPGPQARLMALLRLGPAGEGEWLHALWQQGQPVAALSRRLLAPDAQFEASADAAAQARSPQICNCFDVSQQRIESQLLQCRGSATERLKQLQSALQCGTQCGSCLPSLRRLVDGVAAAPSPSMPETVSP